MLRPRGDHFVSVDTDGRKVVHARVLPMCAGLVMCVAGGGLGLRWRIVVGRAASTGGRGAPCA